MHWSITEYQKRLTGILSYFIIKWKFIDKKYQFRDLQGKRWVQFPSPNNGLWWFVTDFFYSRSCIGTNRFLDVKHMLSQIMRFFLMFNPFVYIVVLMMVAIRCKRTYCIMGDTNYIWEEQYNILVSKLAKNLSVLTLYTLINMLGHNEYNKYSV